MSELPSWLERRYALLWSEFGEGVFRFEDAARVLMDRNRDAWEQVPNFLSELRKASWIFVESDTRDAREKVYRLKSREEAVKEVFVLEKKALTRNDLEGLLKRAADLIRTRVDYKFILILLFLKRISDKWEMEFEQACREALKDGLSEEEARQEAKSEAYHDFDLPEEFRWNALRRDPNMLPSRFSTALVKIAERNPELKDVIDSVDFVQFARSPENAEILRQLMELFSERKLENVSPDILGDAYEWILRYFAPTKAKEGEIYTPREVIKLLVEVLDPKPLESVYDPAAGSGGMLISAFKHVEERLGKEEAEKVFLFGQEANQGILALAKMNMYIHDIRDCHLEFGDTFLYPKFKEGEGLKRFDVVVANPPWNQDGYDEEVLKKGEFWKQRFSYGFVPRQWADWAWIQHMIASANSETGRVGIVIDTGCLSRGGKERSIRSKILDADLVECVILLPKKLFYNTPSEGAIIILRKRKTAKRKKQILFINAFNMFEPHPEVRKLNRLGDPDVEKISNVYRNFRGNNGCARVVSLDEIGQNDYDLNVLLYVPLGEEKEKIEVAMEFPQLRKLEKEIQETSSKLEEHFVRSAQPQACKSIVQDEEHKPTVGLPNGWVLARLGDKSVAEIVMGQSPPSSTYNKKGVGVPFLQGKLEFGEIYPSPITYCAKPIKIAEPNDILLSVRAPVGEVNIAPSKCCIGRGLSAIRPNKEKLDYLFLFYHLKFFGRRFVSAGSTFKAIKKETIENFLIPLPPLPEQQCIAQLLSTADMAIQKTDEEKAKLVRIRSGLMDLLLTGKVRVKVD
jgi:type I restriction enzyme M protein